MSDLWRHQREAVDFIAERSHAMLAMDMGTGKTRVIVEHVRRNPGIDRVLILCPRSVLHVWAPEFAKWGGEECPPVLTCTKGSGRALEDVVRLTGKPAVVVMNYETARQNPQKMGLLSVLQRAHWDLVVFDESHKIKSARGVTQKACASLRAVQKVCLTGTPMPHSPLDIFGQAHAMSPHLLGPSWFQFRARYAVFGGNVYVNGRPVQIVGYKNMDEFERKVAEFTYQVRASEVLQLPDSQHARILCPLPEEAAQKYRLLDREFVLWLENGEAVVASNVLARISKLAQFTGGSVIHEDGVEEVHSAKEDALVDLFDRLPQAEPIVVFANFTADLKRVRRAAYRAGRASYELSGGADELTEWQESDAGDVLGVQIRSGGVGISLVRARHCCYYSSCYSLGDYEQSLARVLRPGQENDVTYWHLIVPQSIDGKIYDALSKKRNVIDEVMKHVRSYAK